LFSGSVDDGQASSDWYDASERNDVMAWTHGDIPDQSGRIAIVTGANGGLGFETTRALARAGAHVVMAARNPDKTRRAEETLRAELPDASFEIVSLDLASLASVSDAAKRIVERHPRIDLLVNNAGVMAIPERKTADGFETQFGVNHLGHFALTAHLLPALLSAEAARVVSVTSTAHHMGRAVDPKNPHLEGRYGEWRAYGQSKLANFHFAFGLQRRFAAAGVNTQSLLAHPGLSDTDLQETSVHETEGGFVQRFFHTLATRTGMTAEVGALPQLRAATDPKAKGGDFYGPLFINNGPPVLKPVFRRIGMEKAIADLWMVSERETGIELDVAKSRQNPGA
jgi:NAD(P)-dependent dehydrogenase (short-subunit alcohol dehydrogenase family)